MIESVDKLREYADSYVSWDLVPVARERLDAMLDEIEEEFALYSLRNYPKPFGSPEAMHMVLGTAADNFDTPEEAVDYMSGETSMPLPVDADGVPVRIGDVMEFAYDPPQDQPIFEVSGFGAKGALFYAPRGEIRARKTTTASVVRHHNPRTLEDVLADVVTLCANAWKDDKSPFAFYDVSDVMASDNIREYADEIRELLGGDAE